MCPNVASLLPSVHLLSVSICCVFAAVSSSVTCALMLRLCCRQFICYVCPNVASLLPSVPTGSPSGLTSVVVNSTSAVLSWRPPLPDDLHGRLTQFQLTVMMVNDSHVSTPHSNLTLRPDLLSVTLHNLTRGSAYSATVAVVTRCWGNGECY